MTTPAERRARALEELASRTFDLLVIGGGINGARVALDAAAAGLAVALVDRGDIASGASSASSKFIHGGLRYLRMGNLRLVHDAQRERSALLREAPHLVRPMPIVLTLDSLRFPRFVVRAGLRLYRGLAGDFGRAPYLTAAQVGALVPSLRVRSSHLAVLLPEAQTDDARLTLATAKSAAAHGATVTNYVSVEDLFLFRGSAVAAAAEDRLEGNRFVVRFRGVVNAAGAHLDRVRVLEDAACRPIARLSKGVHVTLPLEDDWRAGVAAYAPDGRTAFAAPWHGMLLVGTTDTAFAASPEEARVEPGDVACLLDAASAFLPNGQLRPERIRFVFAGLRVLPAGVGDTAAASRGHVMSVGRGGMVSVAGGKFTLHRLIALDALAALRPNIRPRITRPSGRLADVAEPDSDPDPALLRPIHPRAPDTWAQAREAIEHEWAVTVDDLARRRLTLAVRGLATDAVCAELAGLLRSAGFKAATLGGARAVDSGRVFSIN